MNNQSWKVDPYFLTENRFRAMLKTFHQKTAEAFMYMYSSQSPMGPLHFYKHFGTRQYIRIDDKGKTYDSALKEIHHLDSLFRAVGGFYNNQYQIDADKKLPY